MTAVPSGLAGANAGTTPAGWGGWAEVPHGGVTPSAPMGVTYRNKLYLLVRGTDDHIYETHYNGTTWTDYLEVPGGGQSPNQPAAAVYGNKLYLFIRGEDSRFYVNRFNGTHWTGWSEVPHSGGPYLTLSAPTAVTYLGKLNLLIRTTDDHIYRALFDGASWSTFIEVQGAGKTSDHPAASVYGKKLYLFMLADDGFIYRNHTKDGINWTGWTAIFDDGDRIGSPSAPGEVTYAGTLIMLLRGFDDRVYRTVDKAGTWSPYSAIGRGETNSEPTAAVYKNHLWVFIRGYDNRIYRNHRPSS